jgi:signal transduction histidine kinase
VRSRLHAPRSVRMRLTLLCGGVILVSGGLLVAIAFGVGGQRAVAHAESGRNGRITITGPSGRPVVLPSGVAGGQRSSVAIVSGSASGSGGLSVQQVQTAVTFGSVRTVSSLLLWSVLGLAIVVSLGLALGWALSGRMLRPLRTMRDTTQRISEANLHERLAFTGPPGDELRDLADTIDGLLARLEAAFEAQRRFVQNAAHELRTPIAMLRTSLDVATGKPGGVTPEVAALAGKLDEGLHQAERLLEGCLTLAQAQAGAGQARTPVSLSGAVAAAVRERAALAAELGLEVTADLAEATVLASAALVPQIVANLVDNAIRHNEPGGWVRAATEARGERARLVVENGGAILDQARVDELGQPFLRLVERTASDRGAGLGLSIVVAMVEVEGGRLSLQAREAGGLRVSVELPAAHLAELGTSR